MRYTLGAGIAGTISLGPTANFREKKKKHLPASFAPNTFKRALCCSITQTAQHWELDATLTTWPFTRLPCDVHHKVLRWNHVVLQVLYPPIPVPIYTFTKVRVPSAAVVPILTFIAHHWENKLESGACILNPATLWLPHDVPKCFCWVAKQPRVQKLHPGLLWTTSSTQRYLDYMKFELKRNIWKGRGEQVLLSKSLVWILFNIWRCDHSISGILSSSNCQPHRMSLAFHHNTSTSFIPVSSKTQLILCTSIPHLHLL